MHFHLQIWRYVSRISSYYNGEIRAVTCRIKKQRRVERLFGRPARDWWEFEGESLIHNTHTHTHTHKAARLWVQVLPWYEPMVGWLITVPWVHSLVRLWALKLFKSAFKWSPKCVLKCSYDSVEYCTISVIHSAGFIVILAGERESLGSVIGPLLTVN